MLLYGVKIHPELHSVHNIVCISEINALMANNHSLAKVIGLLGRQIRYRLATRNRFAQKTECDSLCAAGRPTDKDNILHLPWVRIALVWCVQNHQ